MIDVHTTRRGRRRWVRSCAIAVILGAPLAGCAFPDAMPGARASCETRADLPTIPAPMDAYAIPAWNVNGQIVTGCGSGGKACGR